MLTVFRWMSLVEGLSLLLLLGVAVPLKYWFHQPQFVPWVGMTHGLLFLAYIVLSLLTSHRQRWSVLFWLLTVLCSVIPFAFVVLDIRLKRMAASE
ncbi:MAG TPA: DUF3817 domain-containing protein [Pseudomonadales bacterium]